MAKLNVTSSLFSNQAAPAAGNQTEREKAKLWLNIGFKHRYTDEKGVEQETLISLPFGLPLDTMTPRKVPNKAGNYRDIVVASNNLLEQLKRGGMDIPVGESQTIDGLTIAIQHVDTEASEDATDTNIETPELRFG